MKRVARAGVLLALLLSVGLGHAQAEGELVVFAAASLTDAYQAIGAAFEEANLGVTVLFNFGGSSTLAAQLVQGAPADVFASANPAQMTVAVEGGRIAEPVRTFARNRLVVLVPADNPANVQTLRDLAAPGVNLILAAPEVPVRAYTDTLLARMADDPAYGEAYRQAVLGNVVSEEPSVRQVSAKVALGEADAGVVYVSDVTPDIADDVRMIPIPAAFNTLARYPIAVTRDSAQPELANRFVDFVLSDAGQDILVEWGFLSVRMPQQPATVPVPADGTLRVDGLVLHPLSLTAERLQSDFAAQTVDIRRDEPNATRYAGVLLWDVLNAAQPNVRDAVSTFVVVTGAEGHQAVIAWGEMDPALGHQPVLIAYAENDRPLDDAPSRLRLLVPSDNSDGRTVRGVVNISLRRAPLPAAR